MVCESHFIHLHAFTKFCLIFKAFCCLLSCLNVYYIVYIFFCLFCYQCHDLWFIFRISQAVRCNMQMLWWAVWWFSCVRWTQKGFYLFFSDITVAKGPWLMCTRKLLLINKDGLRSIQLYCCLTLNTSSWPYWCIDACSFDFSLNIFYCFLSYWFQIRSIFHKLYHF